LRLSNVAAGEYQLVLTNVFGQPVEKRMIQYAGGNTGLKLKTSLYLSSGNYQLEISDQNGFRQVIKLQVLSK
jgi:rhamnose utilization protein RhaD (predicted bifunctional aldolase and dehydrogenase)